MNDKRKDIVYMSVSSSPYADPVTILPSNDIISIKSNSLASLIKIYHPLFLIIIFLLYLLYQIILAGFNCRLEESNLSWIRSSFFLNIPFLLVGIFIIVRYWKKEKSLLFVKFTHFIILSYVIFFFLYWISLAINREVDELKKIGNVLKYATNFSVFPCSKNYYNHVYYLKISHFCSVIIFPVLFILYGYIVEPKRIRLKLICEILTCVTGSSSESE
jgi:hypothetical protein